jgi:hypothetical protein
VTARKILPEVGSDDSRMKMNGDRAADRPKEESENNLQREFRVVSSIGTTGSR